MEIGNGLCALKFGATWCGPCKALEPKIKKMEEEFPSVSFKSVNVDDDPALAKKYQIRSVPTVILLKDGREINRVNGAALIAPLRKVFRELIEEMA
jgi:thioredoxin 1